MSHTETPKTCLHGCGQPVKRNYLPGHDAKHVANIVADSLVHNNMHWTATQVKTMPTPAMHNKLVRALRNAGIVWVPDMQTFHNTNK